MKKLKPWLVILLVFVAGFIGGVVGTRVVVRRTVQTALTNPDRVRELIERRLAARMKLDAAQREKVHTALAESQRELRDLRQEFAPRFRGILSNTEGQIALALTPEQRERFAQFKEENQRLWQVLPPPK